MFKVFVSTSLILYFSEGLVINGLQVFYSISFIKHSVVSCCMLLNISTQMLSTLPEIIYIH